MNTSTTERRPVEELDDIFTFEDREEQDFHRWNGHITELKTKMEKLKGKKDGTSKQKIIQGKGGQTIITAQYWDKELRITVSGGWSKSTLEEVEGLMKALIEVGPATIKGEVFKGRLPRQFALTKYGVADHQAVTEWHNFPFPVKMITLYFS